MEGTLKENLELEDTEKIKQELFLKMKENTSNDSNTFKEGDIEMLHIDSKYYYIKDGQSTIFLENSKLISFINEEKNINKKYFIHDQDSLSIALDKTGIKYAILSKETKESEANENYNSNDSKKSSESGKSANNLDVEDILDESITSIKQQKQIKISEILSHENFIKRFNVKKIKELDFNFYYYYKNLTNDSKVDLININKDWFSDIGDFYKKVTSNSIKYIIGPRGIGKTTNILIYSNINRIHRLYFPIKKLKDFKNRKLNKIALYESIYIFKDEEEMNEFSKFIDSLLPDSEDLLQFILDYIKVIFKFYEEKKLKKRILIILDDYDDDLDNYKIISSIINYIEMKRSKFLLCILGECPYIYKQYYNYIMNNVGHNYFSYWNIKNEKKENFLNLPLYNFRYLTMKKEIEKLDDFRNIIKNELRENFRKINKKNFFSLSKYINYKIDIKELKEDFEFFPFEFLDIEINNENNIIFIKTSFKLDIYKEVFNEEIKGLLMIDNIKSSFNLDKGEDINKFKDGIKFEEIIIEQLWNNTLNLIDFPEKNKIKIKEIFCIKDYSTDTNNIIEDDKPVIIRQTKFGGKYYDLLLIMKNDDEKRVGIFIQIGISKDNDEIIKYYNNISINYGEYKEGIKHLIQRDIDFLGFMLIFDYDKQKILKEKNIYSEGRGFCLENNIYFLLYKNFKLYEDLDSEDPITSINIDKSLVTEEKEIQGIDLFRENYLQKCREMANKNEIPCINIDKPLEKTILDFINNKYNKHFDYLNFIINLGNNIEGKLNFGYLWDIFDQLKINRKGKNKYIFYKNDIFKIKNNNTIEIANEREKELFLKTTFESDLYFLQKKRLKKK